MTDPADRQPGPGYPADRGHSGPTDPLAREHQTWMQRRRTKVVEEIQRNRRGEYKVPTWVLTVILCVIVAAWLALIVLAG